MIVAIVCTDVGDFVPLQYRTILGDFVPHIHYIGRFIQVYLLMTSNVVVKGDNKVIKV